RRDLERSLPALSAVAGAVKSHRLGGPSVPERSEDDGGVDEVAPAQILHVGITEDLGQLAARIAGGDGQLAAVDERLAAVVRDHEARHRQPGARRGRQEATKVVEADDHVLALVVDGDRQLGLGAARQLAAVLERAGPSPLVVLEDLVAAVVAGAVAVLAAELAQGPVSQPARRGHVVRRSMLVRRRISGGAGEGGGVSALARGRHAQGKGGERWGAVVSHGLSPSDRGEGRTTQLDNAPDRRRSQLIAECYACVLSVTAQRSALEARPDFRFTGLRRPPRPAYAPASGAAPVVGVGR